MKATNWVPVDENQWAEIKVMKMTAISQTQIKVELAPVLSLFENQPMTLFDDPKTTVINGQAVFEADPGKLCDALKPQIITVDQANQLIELTNESIADGLVYDRHDRKVTEPVSLINQAMVSQSLKSGQPIYDEDALIHFKTKLAN